MSSDIIVRMLIRAMAKGVLLLLPSLLAAQGFSHYAVEGETGRVRVFRENVIGWERSTGGGKFASLPTDLRRINLIEWVGSGRKFLVAGYRPKQRQGEVVLIELRDEPMRIEVLSRLRVEFEIDNLGYRAKDQQLYLYDDRRVAIHTAHFLPSEVGTVPRLKTTSSPAPSAAANWSQYVPFQPALHCGGELKGRILQLGVRGREAGLRRNE